MNVYMCECARTCVCARVCVYIKRELSSAIGEHTHTYVQCIYIYILSKLPSNV